MLNEQVKTKRNFPNKNLSIRKNVSVETKIKITILNS